MTVAKKEPRPTKAEKIVGVSSSLNEINQELPPTNQNGEGERRIRKKCLGCGDNHSENSDYCRNCEESEKRHILKDKENNPKAAKLHPLTGIITSKEPYKVYHKDSPYQGNQCYKLSIVLEQEKELQSTMFIYPNLVSPEILRTIQESEFIDKRYLFSCEKKKKGWILHKWWELRRDGSDFNKSLPKELNSHEKK